MSFIKKQAIRGAVWTIGSYGISQVLRFGSNLLLTHLLAPKLFGLMTLVNVFITGLHMFSDLGISTSIIQNKRGDEPAFLNTAWTLQVFRGLALWVCCLLIAWPVAQLYQEPQLLWLIPVVGLNTVISGFNSTAIFTLSRHMAVAQLSLYELGGQVATLAVMIVWAYYNKTIWALVVGSFVSSSIQLIWSYRLKSGQYPRFAWEKESIEDLVSFGKWIFISTVMTFLAGQADRLVMGKVFSLELLGVYGVAFALSDVPRQVILAISGRVIFPAFSKFADLPRPTFRAKIQKNRRIILVVMAAILAGVVSFGDMVIHALYNQNYAAAAWMMPLLSWGIWPILLTQTIDPALFAIGKPIYVAYGCFVSALFIIFGIPLGNQIMGALGAVIAISISNIPPYLIITYGLWREQLSCIRQDIWTTGLFLLLLSLTLAARYAAGYGLPIDAYFE
jgi:O-antigen/teichoic acid export membrane protein